jgi:hypothetical protein
VQRAVDAEGVGFRQRLLTPLVTLWTFLHQMLSADGSCREAVLTLTAFLAATGPARPAAAAARPAKAKGKGKGKGKGRHDDDDDEVETGPYCKARARLPEGLYSRLALESGRELHARYPSGPLLGGRKVKMADGTTASMPDTPANQKAWPQPSTQKPGLGFPLARLVVVMSLNCAAVVGLAVGPYAGKGTGEPALLATLSGEALEAGDVLLADRYYASFCMMAALLRRGVDSLFRQHQRRRVDFRTGTRLGRDDHLVTLRKPPERPAWLDEAAFAALPATLTVREVRVRVAQRGFRVKSLVLVTTLLDAQLYSKQEIARAFRCRWHVELDLRAIKQTMGMDVLRCKSPGMVRRELWMRVLAYNLIRGVMAEAAAAAGEREGDAEGVEPREVSFAGAVQAVNAFAPVLALADGADLPRLWQVLLRVVARSRVGDRPDRYEPRAVKRRPKAYKLLTVPRDEAKKRLAKNGAAVC